MVFPESLFSAPRRALPSGGFPSLKRVSGEPPRASELYYRSRRLPGRERVSRPDSRQVQTLPSF